jgi:hypothetical protein
VPRSLVGLLAAAGTTVSVLAPLVHGDLVSAPAVIAGLVTGLSVYFAAAPQKKFT